MIHSDSPFCEIVSRKNYFTTEIGHYGFFISSTSFYNSPKNFIQNLPLDCRYNETILNIDPPYVKKGPLLYKNSFSIDDHSELAQIIQAVEYKWIVTYDECDTIYNLYSNFRKEIITLKYSVGHSRSGRELMIYSDDIELKNFQICF